jgi:hypothetical protein
MSTKIFSFDRKEAEGYARSLAKQRERKRVAREEREIWDGLVAEQIALERQRGVGLRTPRVRRPTKVKPAPLSAHRRDDAREPQSPGIIASTVWPAAVARRD